MSDMTLSSSTHFGERPVGKLQTVASVIKGKSFFFDFVSSKASLMLYKLITLDTSFQELFYTVAAFCSVSGYDFISSDSQQVLVALLAIIRIRQLIKPLETPPTT